MEKKLALMLLSEVNAPRDAVSRVGAGCDGLAGRALVVPGPVTVVVLVVVVGRGREGEEAGFAAEVTYHVGAGVSTAANFSTHVLSMPNATA